MKKLMQEQFIKKSKKVHGNTYDYSLSVYINAKTKIKIICKEHGVFEQTPNNHLNGSRCSICYPKKIKSTTEQFIKKSKKVHGNTYDYSLVKYITNKIKVKIICKEHGVFEQTPNNHLRGQNCPKCIKNIMVKLLSLTTEQFIEKAQKIQGDRYIYSLVDYKNSLTKVKIICKEHGIFEQIANGHLNGQNCPKCSNKNTSKNEIEVYELVEKYFTCEQSNKTILSRNELDIYIPEKKLAIEFNGLYWHSDRFVDKNYHIDKTLECQKQNIQLIHIFEDEWLYKKEIVKSRLLNLIGKSEKIFARKTEIKEVPTKEKGIFLDKNHLQGKVGSKVNLGLYFEDELVSLMTFGKLRKNLGASHKEGSYELLRFCNKLNTSVVGGASKLLKHFTKNYSPKEIISYADLRWSNGNLYTQLGFKEIYRSKPNYFYMKGSLRENRFKYRKDILIKDGFNPNLTEKQIMQERGFLRIYDCGAIKFSI